MPKARSEAATLKLIESSESIRLLPGTKQDAAFMARELIQCTLPHSDPGPDLPAWIRVNGTRALIIQPGYDSDQRKSYGYPWGTLPRLLLFWIVTEAKRTNSRRLHLGHSLAEFMRELGLDPSRGGKRSDAHRLKVAMESLCYARISFQQTTTGPGNMKHDRRRNMDVTSESDLWWCNTDTPRQAVLWQSWIELGEKFFEAITANTVPCDVRALKALKKSPLALDLYALCNYIGSNLQKPDHFISWRLLHEQLGSEYSDLDNFRKKVRAALVKVRLHHPGLNAFVPSKGGGILIQKSDPAIPRLG